MINNVIIKANTPYHGVQNNVIIKANTPYHGVQNKGEYSLGGGSILSDTGTIKS